MQSLRLPYRLTFRALLLLSVGTYLALGPGSQDADILASVIGYSVLLVVLLCISVTLVGGIILHRHLTLDIHLAPPVTTLLSGARGYTSGTPIRIELHIASPSLIPFFFLQIRPLIDPSDKDSAPLVASGELKSTVLSYLLTPRYRGTWSIRGVEMTFFDQLGLSSFSWVVRSPSTERAIQVFPFPLHFPSLELFASSVRPGEASSHALRQAGDFYDLKPYHPSDGSRRIVWKVFARSGDLLSRKPEDSTEPEGEVFIVVFTGRRDDAPASAALTFVRQAIQGDLDIDVHYCWQPGKNATTLPDSELLMSSSSSGDGSTLSFFCKRLIDVLEEKKQAGRPIVELGCFIGLADFSAHQADTIQAFLRRLGHSGIAVNLFQTHESTTKDEARKRPYGLAEMLLKTTVSPSQPGYLFRTSQVSPKIWASRVRPFEEVNLNRSSGDE